MTPSERRIFFRAHLSELYIPFYDALCLGLNQNWAPYFGVRSFSEQDNLYAQGRSRPGGRVTNARGGESAHNYGCASDWTWFDDTGKLCWLKSTDPRWMSYIAAVRKVGLRPGAEFGDSDHNELKISLNWKAIHALFLQDKDTLAAERAIKQSIIPLMTSV